MVGDGGGKGSERRPVDRHDAPADSRRQREDRRRDGAVVLAGVAVVDANNGEVLACSVGLDLLSEASAG